jgi:copper chaperone
MPRFLVPDMTCGHCASTITKALKAEDPHASVEIALAQKLVSVESTLPVEEIAACIAAAGYTPRPA